MVKVFGAVLLLLGLTLLAEADIDDIGILLSLLISTLTWSRVKEFNEYFSSITSVGVNHRQLSTV